MNQNEGTTTEWPDALEDAHDIGASAVDADVMPQTEPHRDKPPCLECGAMTAKEAESLCVCAGDKDDCHGCELWPD